jgi:hypothetical protein
MLSTFSSDVMSISLKRRSGVRVSTASIPGSVAESSRGTARPPRIGVGPDPSSLENETWMARAPR